MRVLMTLVVLVPLAAGTASEAATALTRSSPLCAGVRVTSPGLKAQPRDLVFSAREVLDLQFQSLLRQDLPGDHLLRFKVYTPGGFLYQEIAVPFVGSAPPPDASERAARARSGAAARAPSPPPPRFVAGYPRPLPVQRLVPVVGDTRTRTQYSVKTLLPVAGTSITLGGLFGRWTAQAYLDDQTNPCGPAVRFTIRN
jgi:hypothetical protein